jgi:hypothetical protein
MNVKRLKTILVRKNRPHHRKKKPAPWQITIERPSYDLTIFKVYCGKMALKIYTKGERVLRAEAMAIDARELRCGRDVGQFAKTATKLKEILERFLETLRCLDRCFVSADWLEELSSPSKVGTTRVGGIDFNRPRMRWAARALLALSVRPGGFTASQLAQHVRGQSSGVDSQYGPRQAAYDLQKFRGKKLVCHMKGGRRYETLPAGLRTLVLSFFFETRCWRRCSPRPLALMTISLSQPSRRSCIGSMPNSAARCGKCLIILGLRLRSTTSCRWADANRVSTASGVGCLSERSSAKIEIA